MKCIWKTTAYDANSDSKRQVREIELPMTVDEGQEMQAVNLYPNHKDQTFQGFGAALTEGGAYTFSRMTKEKQQELLDCYFGKDGMGYSQLRMAIDSCDSCLGNYSAMETDDKSFESFSIDRDRKYILPFLKSILGASENRVEVMLSPWSPPPFMKTNGEKNHGGQLKKEYYEMWAEYMCRYVQAYEEEGFPVVRISVQNEPNATQTWDSCRYNGEEEKEFLRDYLYPAMVRFGLSEKQIFIWDHNKERAVERAETILDKDTDSMVSGVAFHWYSGDHFDAIRLLHESYPDKLLAFTEGCVEYSRFAEDDPVAHARMYAHDYIGNLNAGASICIEWNLLLDSMGGPNHVKNYVESPMMYDEKTKILDKKLSIYYIAHMSQYILPGSVRIAASKYTRDLDVTAFQRPDGKIAVVLLNLISEEQVIYIRMNGELVKIALPADGIGTALLCE
ncbi:MAG: glycoside hydrolase family 30 beta sandwich domain-containing protein [Lachnospiraceae bacterium]|nr:glycoside hydrolase family 30 beta sandwich domain-containing protein [Lachnospiraceae bacterium]